ncbi:MAG: sodium:calcium antiporter [Planctomycetaceae bacterium]|nr:sodium:calcium antiporter [Planctomycetaceae bacterium]
MNGLEFTTFPVWLNSLVLTVGGVIVWLSGTRLARLADAISRQTRVSHVLAGALLLGAATSLPEIATTVTASALGNVPLAVNNLFGGVAMQLGVLAVIDFWFVRRGPLTFFSPDPVLLLGGVLLVLQIALSITAIAAGDIAIFAHIGAWPILLAVVYGLSLYFMNRFAERDTWSPSHLPEQADDPDAGQDKYTARDNDTRSTLNLAALFAGNCLLVLAGGWAVSSSADALSAQTGVGSGFIGATLVAVTTSLPEISTTAGAVRLGAYTMAISNIFGTNSLEVALLLPADLAYRPGAVINAVDRSSLVMAAVGIVMTALYLWGLLERRDKAILSMGIDSWWVLLSYISGLGVLYVIAV